MWNDYYRPKHLDEALTLLAELTPPARLVAGGTDVIVELARDRSNPPTLIDISALPGLDEIHIEHRERVHLGPLVTHADVITSEICRELVVPLVQACAEIGAPQIRSRGTVAGNIASASPANDSLTPLYALDAHVTLASLRGTRRVRLADAISGPGRTCLDSDEMIIGIDLRSLRDNESGLFLKSGLRRAQAIAVVNCAVVVEQDAGVVQSASIAIGSAGPTIIRPGAAEATLVGGTLTASEISEAAGLCRGAARPISDIRGSAEYRTYLVGLLVEEALTRLSAGEALEPEPPVTLRRRGTPPAAAPTDSADIDVTVNGTRRVIEGAPSATLSELLRDHCGLPGTKEACGEGECGACTVLIDGTATMSCLVPAPAVGGAQVQTIEGLRGTDGELHPIQQAFIDHGASQCGFCTPGMIMSTAALFDEHPKPTPAQLAAAISGNLCRCTTYYPIIAALEAMAKAETKP